MMGFGKIAYKFYYRPLSLLQATFRTGLKRTAEIKAGRINMMKSAFKLHEIVKPGAGSHEVYFLTGKKYWYQTVFCLYSLQQQSSDRINAVIIDDGSFDDELEKQILFQFPSSVRIVRAQELKQYLDEKLPEKKFPVLRQRRIIYPHIRKLTDIHVLPGNDHKLVLDSDMLFFGEPTQLLNWLQRPTGLLFMRDTMESYGYSHRLMQALSKAKTIPERLNVGVAGLASSKICWDQLEFWTKEMLNQEGSSYLQEQALTAMIASQTDHCFLSEQAYKVLPAINGAEVAEILHHYVAESKYDYFVKGWRLIKTGI